MNKIMETNKFNDVVFYRAGCSCGDTRHDLSLTLEANTIEDSYSMISLMLINNMYYDAYHCDHWYEHVWHRIKGAVILIFVGFIKVESEFIFDSKEQIEDFTKTLTTGIKYLENVE